MAGKETETEGGTNGATFDIAASRAATLAAMEKGEHLGEPKPEPEKSDKGTDEDEDDDVDVDDDDDDELEEKEVDLDEEDDDEEEDDEDKDESDDEDEDKADDAAAKDPDLAKRLDHVRKLERRAKDTIQREEQRIAKAQSDFIAEWKPRIEKAERFDQLSKKVNPFTAADILRELGLPDDDFEEAGRVLYALSKKGAEDPKNKEYVARSRRERERDEEISTLKKKWTEREETDKQTAAEQAIARENDQYLGTIGKAAKKHGEKFPLAARAIASNTDGTRAQLAGIAAKLWERDGERPSVGKVLKRYEKQRRAELEALGVDVEAVIKAPAKTSGNGKIKTKTKDDKKAAAPIVTDGSVPKSIREHRAETLRLLKEGKLD